MQGVIRLNHDPVQAARNGITRTYSLIALRYWWPGMRKSVEEFVKSCKLCQRRKGNREFVAPHGEVEEPTAPFLVTSLDITCPYMTTPIGNKYLLTFIDHFTKYVEAFPIHDQTAETCARIYTTQIVTRHGTGSHLITDQGRSVKSSFFQDTCKVLGIRTTRNTSYHPQSNDSIESGIAHFTRVYLTTLIQQTIIGTH
jgi:transposase InsO family protein